MGYHTDRIGLPASVGFDDEIKDYCGLDSVSIEEFLESQKEKAPRLKGFFFTNWWRRRESNPRPRT
jgi:hypothetical protein